MRGRPAPRALLTGRLRTSRRGDDARGRGDGSRPGSRPVRPAGPAVHVDHRHRTGRVPGVLLQLQSGRRQVGDDRETLRRAAAYLEGNAWKPTLVAPGVYQLPS
ncbi:endonuclease domain-containing protein [Streptomyces genisteinicus]|uniref:endonuclease domain-containing protein n=1 Tax=Streptomyces genisteinicus TaxID=2768068 RepID=UPI0031B5AE39